MRSCKRFAVRSSPRDVRSRDVTCRTPEAGDEPEANRIGWDHHDDRDRPGCFLRRRYCGVVRSDNDFHVEPHQLDREVREAFGFRMRPSPFNGDVLPLHVADLTLSFVEGSCEDDASCVTALAMLKWLRPIRPAASDPGEAAPRADGCRPA